MSQGIDEAFLRELGFLPDGETEGEFGLHIWDVNQEVVELDDENNMQLVFSVPNQELYIEAYDSNCHSVSITQLPTPVSCEALITLLRGLGAYKDQLADHVQRELDKYMPKVQVTKFDYLTVFRGACEVIVYGGESDWIVQYARVTNPDRNFRRWFSSRDKAEQYAVRMAAMEYQGHQYHKRQVVDG